MTNDFRYQFQELDGAGEPKGETLILTWRELKVRVSFCCPDYKLSDLNHMIALAHCGNPVDLVRWTRDTHGEAIAVKWSARIEYLANVKKAG